MAETYLGKGVIHMHINQSPGMVLLSIYLILGGLALLLSIVAPPIIVGLIMLAAGILLLFGR
jgi:hypothetical protein